jgi:hypothetical protein
LNEFLAGIAIKNNSKKIFAEREFAQYLKAIFKDDYKPLDKTWSPDESLKQTPESNRKGPFEADSNISQNSRSIITNVEYSAGDLASEGQKFFNKGSANSAGNLLETVFKRRFSYSLATVVLYLIILGLGWYKYYSGSANQVETGISGENKRAILAISTEPKGANVWINGIQSKSLTPISQVSLDAGKAAIITISKQGFKSRVINFNPKSGKDQALSIPLEPVGVNGGEVLVFSEPQGAEIYLSDNSTGLKTPAVLKDVEIGKVLRLTLKLNGYLEKDLDFEVGDTGRKYLNLYLEKGGM